MMLAMAGYVLNDVFIKLTSGELGLFQAIFVRGLFASVFIFLLARHMGALDLKQGVRNTVLQPSLTVRTLSEVGATVCFLSALFNMPIANVTSILQLLPLTVMLGAAWLFSEKIGWRRYLASLVGFLGVLLIVRPGGEGFNVYSLSAVGAVFFVTVRDLITRRLSDDTPSLFVSLITAVAITLAGGIGSLFETWQPVSNQNLIYLAAAAASLLAGYIFSILTMRAGEIGFISPFRYSILLWALLLGFVVFNEIPDGLALLGATVIVASGLFSFYRERKSALS